MSNLNPDQFGSLFHGSNVHAFKPDDMITPRTRDVAYATPSTRTARLFAGEEGRIYQVEALPGDQSVLKRRMKYIKGTHHEVISKQGFRVLREVPNTNLSPS